MSPASRIRPTLRNTTPPELSAEKHAMLYVPKGFAHGFRTLEDDCEVFYMMGEYYHPESARGMRWDDEDVKIAGPARITSISKSDGT